jgi:hypothetical protein
MAFNSKDLMVSLLSFQHDEAGCPETTLTPMCTTSIGPGMADSDGLALLQQQLRLALSQPAA